MLVIELIEKHQKNHPESHFFDKETLEFFGETIRTMRVSRELVDFEGHKCYELTTLQQNSPFINKHSTYYFDCETFENIQDSE